MTDTPKDAFDAIDYPCDYKFKAVCNTVAGLQEDLLQQVNDYFGVQRVIHAAERPSKNGKFTSVTFETKIEDRAQLEAVYKVLASNKNVVMTL